MKIQFQAIPKYFRNLVLFSVLVCQLTGANRCKTSNIVNTTVRRSYLLYFFTYFFGFPCFSTGKGSIDKANAEVRNIILRIWPKTPLELLDRVVQPPGTRKYLSL